MASPGGNGVPARRIGLENSSGGNSGAKLAGNSVPGEIPAPNWQGILSLGIFSRSFRGQRCSWRGRLSIILLQSFVGGNRLTVFEAKTARKIPPSRLWRPNAGDFVPRNRIGGQESPGICPEPALAAKRTRRFAPSRLWRPNADDFVPRNRIGGQESPGICPEPALAAKRTRRFAPSRLWRPNADDFVPRNRIGGQESPGICPEPALAAKRTWRIAPGRLWRPSSAVSVARSELRIVTTDAGEP